MERTERSEPLVEERLSAKQRKPQSPLNPPKCIVLLFSICPYRDPLPPR